MKNTIFLVVLSLALCVAGFAAPATAELGAVRTEEVGALGAQGEVYLAKVVPASQFAPDPAAANVSDHPILALEVLRPGAEPEWYPVPESERVNPEASHFVLYEPASDTTFVVWEGHIGSHPVIKLASFRDGTWSEVLHISDNIWSLKGFPQLAITRDRFETEDGVVLRTVLHTVWWEETLEGDRTLYRPLLLENGQVLVLGPSLLLDDLVSSQDSPTGVDPDVSPELLHRPRLHPAGDGRSTLVLFTDGVDGRFHTLDVGLLPAALGLLGQSTHDFITGLDPRDLQGEDIGTVAGLVRGHIAIGGYRGRLNPRVVSTIAQEIHDVLEEEFQDFQPGDLQNIADVVRGHIAIGGARISRETLERLPVLGASGVLAFGNASTGGPLASSLDADHLVRLLPVLSLPAPEVGDDFRIFVSPDGLQAAVAWQSGQQILFRDNLESDEWSDVHTLELSEDLSPATALQIIRKRVVKGF